MFQLNKISILRFPLKFLYSEKATKFWEISTLLMSYVVPVKSKVEISQNFEAFLEYMNSNQNVLSFYNNWGLKAHHCTLLYWTILTMYLIYWSDLFVPSMVRKLSQLRFSFTGTTLNSSRPEKTNIQDFFQKVKQACSFIREFRVF